ncbi:hypothetical protein HF086_012159 [Spodoptera exigua]|uniref:Uncharacterized protein n=1 Tax=Spodoptera exigua TaxID=7107 RepID=A0A922M7J6_SPOEX|nr:hypothetical protein HF086_012159 [Spodoptera exigua]
MMTKVKAQGLVSDLMPNIKLMQAAGHFLFNYHSENGGMTGLLRKIYASTHAILITIHFACMGINMAQYSDEVNELTANTITVYWLLFSMAIANLMDVMFCSWLIFACEQLQHLKAIMKPLMELSASLDTYRPNTAELFRASSTEKSEKIPDTVDMDIRGIYSTQQDFGMTLRGAGGRLQNFGQQNNNPNGLTPKQEMLVASIGDTYGTALLFHMLVSTITLTLLAYQATKINGINVYAFSTIGYLSYTLGQVFHFCIFGNRLIEEVSRVLS